MALFQGNPGWGNIIPFGQLEKMGAKSSGSKPFSDDLSFVGFLRVPGCSRGGNWGTLRIPAGKIGEP